MRKFELIKKLKNFYIDKDLGYLVKIRIFLWSLLILVIGVILYLGIVPFGHITYTQSFAKKNEFIGALTPKDRLVEGEYPNTIIGNPVYFSLHTPRTFDSAIVSLKYKEKNPHQQSGPIIEMGALVDKTVWRYGLQPLENKIVDALIATWDNNRKGDLLFLQKEKKFADIDEFLKAVSETGNIDLSKVATYNYDLKTKYLIKDYKKTKDNTIIDHSLRGAYQFYTYIDKEDLDIVFYFTDLNKNKDPDDVGIKLYSDNKLLKDFKLNDDGNKSDNAQESAFEEFGLKIPDLNPGVYKIEIKANDDIVTKKINSKQDKLAFVNGLRLNDAGKVDFTLFTDSKKIQAKTIYPGLLQTIKIADSELKLSETYKQFEVIVKKASSLDRVSKISLKNDGIFLNGDGVFSFSQEALLNPGIKKVDSNIDIQNDGIEYILAKYQTPVIKDDWKEANISLDLRGAYREKGKYSFLISVPDLKIDDNLDDGLIIKEIKIDLTGWSIISKIKNFFQKI